MGRPEAEGESFLRLALELNPEHTDAANNLGYQLADRGVNLDEAERLLEMAHRLKPEEPNIIDSLGWLRYKQGRLTDVPDESGAGVPHVVGAITLLERAAAMLEGQAGQVTLDQLGDALWRAGRRDEAWERWTAAIPLGDQTVQAYTDGGAPPAMLEEARQRVERLREKVRLAEELMNGLGTTEPPVAPLGEGVTSAQ
jgi:hypothetical protein